MLHRHHDVDDGGRGEEMLARRGPQSRESCPTRLNVLQLFLRILNGSHAASSGFLLGLS